MMIKKQKIKKKNKNYKKKRFNQEKKLLQKKALLSDKEQCYVKYPKKKKKICSNK
jgi:hypothetical protein